MVRIVNATAHAIRFQSADGQVYEVPPCGVVVNAQAVEEPAGKHPSGVELVTTYFEPTLEEVQALANLEWDNPDAIVVGSIIAAQAFPGRVFAMVPVPGFERVPPAEKRMRDDKFITF